MKISTIKKKAEIVCPFCDQPVNELPKGLEVKEIIKRFKCILKAIKKTNTEPSPK